MIDVMVAFSRCLRILRCDQGGLLVRVRDHLDWTGTFRLVCQLSVALLAIMIEIFVAVVTEQERTAD